MKKVLAILCVIAILLMIPFGCEKASYSSIDITLYKAALYTVVRIEAYGITRTRVYFFPSNLDANNNLSAFDDLMGSLSDTMSGLLN